MSWLLGWQTLVVVGLLAVETSPAVLLCGCWISPSALIPTERSDKPCRVGAALADWFIWNLFEEPNDLSVLRWLRTHSDTSSRTSALGLLWLRIIIVFLSARDPDRPPCF